MDCCLILLANKPLVCPFWVCFTYEKLKGDSMESSAVLGMANEGTILSPAKGDGGWLGLHAQIHGDDLCRFSLDRP